MKQKLKLSSIARGLFILSTLMELGNGTLIIKPSSTEALIGQKIRFNCSSSIKSSEIQWFHYPIQENSQRQLVYGYGKMGPNYSRLQIEHDNATGAFNLVIPSVALGDSGNYECQEEYGRGEKSSTELIVLESLPVCASATDLTKVVGKNNCGIKSDQLLFSCVVQYKGNEPPVMKWRKLGEQTTIDSPIAPTKQSDKIIYNITMDGASVDNGSAFECFASRAAASTKCLTNSVTVISKIVHCEVCEVCEVCSCNCNYTGAIFIFIFVVIAIGIAIATSLYFFYFQKQKGEVKEKSEKQMDAVFCVNFIPFFIGAALGLYWYLRRYTDWLKDFAAETELLTTGKGESNKETEVVAMVADKRTPEEQGKPITERLQQRIRDLELKNKKQGEEQQNLLKENEDLRRRIQELEETLYTSDHNMDYVKKPSAVHTINTEENRLIVGLAVLRNSLFVSREKTTTIEVYDSATYVSQRQVEIPQLKEPFDMASCVQLSCLFVIDRLDSSKDSISYILKIKPDGEFVTKWEFGGNSGRLSTYESNVIVCLSDKLLVREFTHEGNPIREVRLSPSVGFKNLIHAIKVSSVHFVVSHGEKDDKLRRVCLVNGEGTISKTYEYREKAVPVCLLNDSGRSILVGDKEGRIILLNSNLRFQGKLIEKADNSAAHRISILEKADNCVVSRISFDETEKRLFVARNKVSSKPKGLEAGQVLVFNVK